MKTFKYILQIVSAFLYSNLFTGIMYLVIVLPLAWIISLPWWGMLLVLVFGGGIIEGIISFLTAGGLLPFAWIVKGNIVSLCLSLLIIIFNLGRSTIVLWQSLVGNGFWAVMLAVVFTGFVIQLLLATIPTLISMRSEDWHD